MQCFILAGGYATRLWPLTEKRSKPLLPLAGKPLLTHLIEQIPAGMPVTVSTNGVFEAAFCEWQKELKNENVHLHIEDTKHEDHKLGALGALGAWIEECKIDDDLLILTGDNYLGFRLDAFLSFYKGDRAMLAAHDIGDLTKASAFGTVIVSQEAHATPIRPVLGFEEKPKEPKTTLVSTGCFVLPKKTLKLVTEFAKQKPDNIGGVFEELLRCEVPVSAYLFTEPWLDIGSFSSYLAAHRLLVAGRTVMGHASHKDAETVFIGSNCLGDGTTVKQSSLQDCIVFQNCMIEDCVLKDCIVDDGCILKGVDLTGQMLRAGTVLEKSS